MRTSKFRHKTPTNKDIYAIIMKAKSEIDTIAELKGLDDGHDLVLASNHLDNVLNALDEQGVISEK